MKRSIACQGDDFELELNGDSFQLGQMAEGSASVVEIRPGLYSILFADGESVTVDIVSKAPEIEASTGVHRYRMTVTDPRDRKAAAGDRGQHGPAEVRAIMPGKIIKVLVEENQEVETGAGLLIVEAMKMQNETKSPRNGTVRRIQVTEGAAVAAGTVLLVIE